MGIFSAGEMDRRNRAVRAWLVKRKLDACFVHSADNVFYLSGVPLLSGWGRPMWVVITAKGPSAICGAMIEKENMEKNTATGEVLVYADEENVEEAAVKLCAAYIRKHVKGRLRIGIEEANIPYGLYGGLRAQFDNADFVDAGPPFSELRIIKSREELDLLELGGRIAKLGADAFLEALVDNVTELAVASHANNVMDKALGALSDQGISSTYTYAQFGEHTLTPHLHATGRRLRRGELVALNVFPVIWGYCAELERTFVFGTANKKQAKALDAVNEAFDAGKKAVRPGIQAREIDRLTRQILTRRGYDKWIRHGTGHAHGIMIGSASREELGELRSYNSFVLKPNMANSVEPGFYLPDLGGFRHSDVMLVTKTGARCVTDFSRDIIYGP